MYKVRIKAEIFIVVAFLVFICIAGSKVSAAEKVLSVDIFPETMFGAPLDGTHHIGKKAEGQGLCFFESLEAVGADYVTSDYELTGVIVDAHVVRFENAEIAAKSLAECEDFYISSKVIEWGEAETIRMGSYPGKVYTGFRPKKHYPRYEIKTFVPAGRFAVYISYDGGRPLDKNVFIDATRDIVKKLPEIQENDSKSKINKTGDTSEQRGGFWSTVWGAISKMFSWIG